MTRLESSAVDASAVAFRTQRTEALSTFILTVGLLAAALIIHYPGDRRGIEQTQVAIETHVKLLREAETLLRVNQESLAQERRSLEQVQAAAKSR